MLTEIRKIQAWMKVLTNIFIRIYFKFLFPSGKIQRNGRISLSICIERQCVCKTMRIFQNNFCLVFFFWPIIQQALVKLMPANLTFCLFLFGRSFFNSTPKIAIHYFIISLPLYAKQQTEITHTPQMRGSKNTKCIYELYVDSR